ncbi:MAG: RNA polymerase sigma factor [Micromonosporaceae bacterium]
MHRPPLVPCSHLSTIKTLPPTNDPSATSGPTDLREPGELLRRASQRDQAAWDALVSRFGQLVLHTARRVGLNSSDAADVVQLTWLRLLEHVHQIREPERLPAWLAATARREGLRVAIASKRHVLCADPAAEQDRRTAVIDVYPVDGDYEPAVEEALASLPSRYQTLLRLLMSDSHLSYTEIARVMRLPIGSIGPMRMRALQMMRRSLALTCINALLLLPLIR